MSEERSYLYDCPELPPGLLEKLALEAEEPTPQEQWLVRRVIAGIDLRRARHELLTGKLVVPEEPMLPHELDEDALEET